MSLLEIENKYTTYIRIQDLCRKIREKRKRLIITRIIVVLFCIVLSLVPIPAIIKVFSLLFIATLVFNYSRLYYYCNDNEVCEELNDLLCDLDSEYRICSYYGVVKG